MAYARRTKRTTRRSGTKRARAAAPKSRVSRRKRSAPAARKTRSRPQIVKFVLETRSDTPPFIPGQQVQQYTRRRAF